ncbi:MAG: hypothetical protein ACXVBK_15470 [Flavisolibacter sp.]
MKKVICLIAVALMVASVVLAAPKVPMTAKDLRDLKGTWTGILSFGKFEGGGTSPAKLEILSETVPVKAKLTINNIPQQVASQVGLQSGENVFDGEGIMTTQGTLMFMGPQKNFIEIGLISKEKINVRYVYQTLSGEGDFSKKKK